MAKMWKMALILTLLVSCSKNGNDSDESDSSGGDSDGDTDTDADTDTDSDTSTDDGVCETVFGKPSENTGLTEEQCMPSCECEGISFTAPDYTEAQISEIEALELLVPFDELEASPYDTPEQFPGEPDKLCGMVFDEKNQNAYRLETFPNEEALQSASAMVTHYGACGLCSTLEDLGVYMRNVDLTEPVRDCGFIGMTEGEEANIECLQDLGFTLPCAQIWYYNTVNTRENCIDPCMDTLNDPYHEKDGSLNECLQCDEDFSGDVFKAVAGRTRRNSGLPTSICRPCPTVAPVFHNYLQNKGDDNAATLPSNIGSN